MIFLHEMLDLLPFSLVDVFLILFHDFLNGKIKPPWHIELESIVLGDSFYFGLELGSSILSFEILFILDDELYFQE